MDLERKEPLQIIIPRKCPLLPQRDDDDDDCGVREQATDRRRIRSAGFGSLIAING